MHKCAAYALLQQHVETLTNVKMIDLFVQDAQRVQKMSVRFSQSGGDGGIYFDYAKNKIDARALALLLELAQQAQLPEKIAGLMRGDKINFTEDRAVLHTALRGDKNSPHAAEVAALHQQMEACATRLRAGQWQGFSGQAITDIVNIGIGGSDLGPRMVCRALGKDTHLNLHFISNIDFTPFAELLKHLNPATTLFISSSKSFRTPESLRNTRTAIAWVKNAAQGKAIDSHFIGVTSNRAAALEMGILSENIFPLWDWVGGRYSVWSAIGLPIAIMRGWPAFKAFLAGAYAMDQHFATAPLAQNMPVLLGLLGVWHRNFLGTRSQCVNPYSDALSLFSLYLQQLEMESNGKSVMTDGSASPDLTGQVVWGDVGTNAQHAYFQFLHQGNDVVPVDFIAVLEAGHQEQAQHQFLLANALAQAEVLMRGAPSKDSDARMRAHKTLPGNRSSNLLLLKRLDPYHLGALIALYEHKTFTQGVLWQVNSFDQFGVEAGKTQADAIMAKIDGNSEQVFDSSTETAIQIIRQNRL